MKKKLEKKNLVQNISRYCSFKSAFSNPWNHLGNAHRTSTYQYYRTFKKNSLRQIDPRWTGSATLFSWWTKTCDHEPEGNGVAPAWGRVWTRNPWHHLIPPRCRTAKKKLHFKAIFFNTKNLLQKNRIKRDEANLSGILFVRILVRVRQFRFKFYRF